MLSVLEVERLKQQRLRELQHANAVVIQSIARVKLSRSRAKEARDHRIVVEKSEAVASSGRHRGETYKRCMQL
jgi:hypothetical protein